MATLSSNASTVAMDASQLVVEAEVYTNETLQRDLSSDVNKDLGPKAKGSRPRPRPWGIKAKAKAKDLGPKAKAKAKDLRCQSQ